MASGRGSRPRSTVVRSWVKNSPLRLPSEPIGHEGVVDLAVHDRVGVEPQPAGAGTNARQALTLVMSAAPGGPPSGMLTLTVLALMEAR